MILSCADAIGRILERALQEFGIVTTPMNTQQVAVAGIANMGLCPQCPECGGMMEHEGGCAVCRMCGFSKCM
jgi:ribonucleoside-diphosphate reductase alpha chain